MLSMMVTKALTTLLVLGAAPKKSEVRRLPEAVQLAGTGLAGENLALKRYLRAGTQAVLISFLEPGDPDCKREQYQLRKLYLEWRDAGVVVLQVGSETRKVLRAFVDENAVVWPVVVDRDKGWASTLEVGRGPWVVVVGRGGRIYASEQGYSPKRYRALRAALAHATRTAPPWGVNGSTPPFLRAQRHYQFGRPPSGSGSATRWEPLAAHLTRSSRAFIKMASAETYANFETALAAGQYEIINVGPLLASRVLDQYEPVATLERGKRGYKGVLFTHRRTQITSLAQLRGKSVALVSPTSSSGGIYPFARLLAAGLKAEEDITIMWLGSHGKVARAVRSGKAVAGGCFAGCEALAWVDDRERERDAVVLAYTESIPAELILVRRDLPADERRALRRALLASSKAADILQKISGKRPITKVRRADEQTLSAVRKIYRKVRTSLEFALTRGKEREAREAAARQREILKL